ncbi:hypothetical protein [Hymenobacter sp. YC55]|uniref:hypothetical protein n=1 Tax=Hymenobacter sp. YC55 TaxID=3034019 RepID=UPI0023F69909|nr:hypothetical protein [Hymenobacter sp. YC55]MDF7815350.1 hypothetical protein [Hymenobacter sp. YC55]
MPFVTLIAEQHLVFTRKIEVSDEELAELQAQLAEGRQDVSHLVAEDHLSEENILEDSGYEAVRLVLH